MIIEAIYHGPGAQSTQQYMTEIILIVFGAFLLGYLFRYFLNDKLKGKIKSQAAELKELRSNAVGKSELEAKQKEVDELQEKVNRLNTSYSNAVSDKMGLENELSKLKAQQHNVADQQPKQVEDKPASSGTSSNDDLTKIEGIGPKIAQLLKAGGISTYAELTQSSSDNIRAILIQAGPNYAVHNPDTWGEQARMAMNGDWDKLKAWQKELKGGKRKP